METRYWVLTSASRITTSSVSVAEDHYKNKPERTPVGARRTSAADSHVSRQRRYDARSSEDLKRPCIVLLSLSRQTNLRIATLDFASPNVGLAVGNDLDSDPAAGRIFALATSTLGVPFRRADRCCLGALCGAHKKRLCEGGKKRTVLATEAAMQLEIQVALNFIISYLYNKLPRRRVNIFGEELERQLKKKYEGHWYLDKPYKGSGFRCIHVGEKVDPVVELAAKESGLDIDDVRNNLPQDLSVWIDPFEVSYQIGEKGPVKVLYVDDNNENGSELDKEIKNSFNPEAQVFMPISDPVGASSESSSPSPPFGQSAAVSPSFMPRSTQPLTFTTATFAATKFGSTKMKSSGRCNNSGSSKAARSSPTNNLGLNVNTLLKQKAISTSMHSLYGLGQQQQQQQQKASALSPNAKEFVFPSLQGQASPGAVFPGEGSLGLGPLPYNNAFDMFAAYGSLNDKSLMDGLNFSLSNMQYSNQQFQPVMAN
ncbi:Tob1 [Scophthalmus maximus]|uniref:Tob1 n=1 Tax=Scophthalmus maximus TaxID=52904 RepID=A0A2U9CKX6_SCOMX|nr:Tob1 [Scophthalmus maximus]